MSIEKIRDLASRYLVLRDELDKMKAETTKLQKEFDEIRLNLLPSMLEEDGIDSARLEDIGTVYTTADLHVSVPADKKEFLFDWLRDNGAGSLITETVNASTLKAWVKERIANGRLVPEIVNVSPFTRAAIKGI